MGQCPCMLAISSERTGIQNKTAINREYYPQGLANWTWSGVWKHLCDAVMPQLLFEVCTPEPVVDQMRLCFFGSLARGSRDWAQVHV